MSCPPYSVAFGCRDDINSWLNHILHFPDSWTSPIMLLCTLLSIASLLSFAWLRIRASVPCSTFCPQSFKFDLSRCTWFAFNYIQSAKISLHQAQWTRKIATPVQISGSLPPTRSSTFNLSTWNRSIAYAPQMELWFGRWHFYTNADRRWMHLFGIVQLTHDSHPPSAIQ